MKKVKFTHDFRWKKNASEDVVYPAGKIMIVGDAVADAAIEEESAFEWREDAVQPDAPTESAAGTDTEDAGEGTGGGDDNSNDDNSDDGGTDDSAGEETGGGDAETAAAPAPKPRSRGRKAKDETSDAA